MEDGGTGVELDLNRSGALVRNRRTKLESVPTLSEAGDELERFGIRTDDLEATVAELKAKE